MSDSKAIEPVSGDVTVMEATFKKQEITPNAWRMIAEIAPVIFKSRLFGVSSADAAAAIMLKGYELGLGITTAFEYISIISGRTSMKPIGAWALVLNSGELEASKIVDEQKDGQPYACTVYLKRKNGIEYTSRITLDDARRSGHMKEGSGWMNYPANMLRWRALGFAIDVVFPDIQGGMKRADEFGATVTLDGEVIGEQWGNIPAQNAYAQVPASTQQLTGQKASEWLQARHEPTDDDDEDLVTGTKEVVSIQTLIDSHGAEAVLTAMQKITAGAPPANQDEVDAIAKEVESA